MANTPYPTSISELPHWSKEHGTTTDESRKRFMQFVTLECISESAPLRDKLAFKGGNALRFIYGNRRTTVDLDFSAMSGFPQSEQVIRTLLEDAFKQGGRRFGIKMRVQRVRQNPPGENRTMPTFDISVAYQFPGDPHFADLETWPRPLNQVIAVEISINDVVCETVGKRLSTEQGFDLRVCTLEDILAEKLRALLQQPIRHRHRKQDPLDIANMVRKYDAEINRAKVTRYLIEKCRQRGIEARKSAFNEQVQSLAAYEYETLFSAAENDFVPFDEAWSTVKRLVAELQIQD